ncbi:hypothetical protein PFICI_13587 [Pestalotiopsis fici W106-1]|uniref:Extracellular membrane protein CFEM domain-containing protein n=1 Tax=Pestalotiopsis fici (strain W106-1 / CGMCC3.15140) TaxID=1229662 RepID=W3WML1_PESFW|nr:uncharacterized protein PFICI_13587 [Pestalotiopsis fici W106-1]ETS75103.1 hypothetical protein PFICI_13587 [Pestalotiopsis fici W106-1]
MHFTTAFLIGLASFSAAQNIIQDGDKPESCLETCQDPINISKECDNSTGDSDDYHDCVCSSADAQSRFTECNTCIVSSSGSVDNDVADEMAKCGWSTSSTSNTTSSTAAISATSSATGASSSAAATSAVADSAAGRMLSGYVPLGISMLIGAHLLG